MQNAKDSFYGFMRSRLAELNPERTVVVRGVTRPGVVVDENEMQSVAALADCFHLRWPGLEVDTSAGLPRVMMQCEIFYETAGSTFNGGLDRGRALAAMDAELVSALSTLPFSAPKFDYSAVASGGSVKKLATNIWWGEPLLKETTTDHDRVGRSVVVSVMSFVEPGENA